MSRLSGMVNSSDSVITPLITVLAEVPEEFSPSSASIGTETNIRLTNEMLTENATTLSFRSLVERSKNCIAATGMIMKSTSVNLDPHNNRTNTSWKVDEVRLTSVKSKLLRIRVFLQKTTDNKGH